jgi:hypothetical protein
MKRSCGLFLVICGLMGLAFAGMTMANGTLEGGAPAIMVSPSTIVLAKVATVSVHTNVPADTVDAGSLDLNGVAPSSVYVDSLGHIAAKFAVADLELERGEATLTLSGLFNNGGSFSAFDTVIVR